MPAPETRGRDLNHVAWLYDPLVEKLSFGKERRFRQQTIDIMHITPEQNILDVGCGTGSLTLMIADHLDNGSVTGIDAAPKMIAIARRKAKRHHNKALFENGVAEKIDFADGIFDTVVNSMFSHHIDTELKQRAFAEMFRVLKPGGILVTADIDRPTTRLASWIGWLSRYILLQPELEDNLLGNLPTIMNNAGFSNINRCCHLYNMVSFFTAIRPAIDAPTLSQNRLP